MRKITMKAGSAEWIASRSASKAPAMMGCDPTTSRTELIHMMATGFGKEFSDWQQKYLLDKGNVSEIGARALAEEVVGEDFVPSSAETADG
jgi:predicted phage-related endonuclease